jgi:DNA-directed RNA polymerase subunit K/omega
MNIVDDIIKMKYINPNNYKSTPIMTKYEFDQIISLRVTALSKGSLPFIDVPENFKITTNMELRKIALIELKENKLPMIIKRPMGNTFEYWKIKDLDLSAVRYLLRE